MRVCLSQLFVASTHENVGSLRCVSVARKISEDGYVWAPNIPGWDHYRLVRFNAGC